MAFQQDEFSAAYARQMELAEQCFDFGMAVSQRMLMAQMDGTRQLFELQGRQFSAFEDSVGEQPSSQWVAFCQRVMASANEALEVCLQTTTTLQDELVKVAEEFLPMINRSLVGSMERATQALAVAPAKFEAPRKRAA